MSDLSTAADSTAADDDAGSDDGAGTADDTSVPGGLSWGRALVLAAALAFLGFAVGVFVSRDVPPGEGSVDVGFYRDMAIHHEQALSMATLELAHGEDATVRSYAREVLTFQSYEIGVMRRTLDEWGRAPQSGSGEVMAWMGMGRPVDEMPGLATDAEIGELGDARGPEADALFLRLMVEHHRGGLHMAEYAAERAGDDGVRELAARMVGNQTAEIAEYRAAADRLGVDLTP